jgi:hypothetical protein
LGVPSLDAFRDAPPLAGTVAAVRSALLALRVVLAVGTTARLTRLVTADSITEPVREWIATRAKRENPRLWAKLDDLVQCPWCVSVWVSFPTALALVGPAGWVMVGGTAMTASLVTGNVQTRERDADTVGQAGAVAALVDAGFTKTSAIAAILNHDLTLLSAQGMPMITP